MQVQVNFKNIAIVSVATFFLYLIYLLWGSGTPKLEIPSHFSNCVSKFMDEPLVHQEKQLQTETKSKTKEGRDEFVTRADLISNQIIQETLNRFPGIKIVSEENVRLPQSEIEKYKGTTTSSPDLSSVLASEKVLLSDLGVWVDPLDATQEFTVWAYDKYGVFPNSSVLNTSASPSNVIIVSRSHAGPVESFAKAAFSSQYTVEPAGGSGYKTLRVVNGTAAMYLHKTAIKKWDLCAGDAIVRAAGGKMTTLSGIDLTYFPRDHPQITQHL